MRRDIFVDHGRSHRIRLDRLMLHASCTPFRGELGRSSPVTCQAHMWSLRALKLSSGCCFRSAATSLSFEGGTATAGCRVSTRNLSSRPSSSKLRRPTSNASLSTTTTAAAATTTQEARAVKLPRHLSPLWNKRHDLSLFGSHVFTMSLSEAAGHLSFIFLGMGFLETDLLPLRVYAAAGVSCSIAFQYYRPQPLWIPVSWNAIFLGINAGMVGLLLKDENDARQQDQDSASLYDRTFRESGLTAVDFMKIKSISEASRHRAGEVLTTQDVTQRRLYLVMEGDLDVAKHGTQIATVGAGEFTGEMSFLRHVRRECIGQPGGCNCVAVADVTVKAGGARVTSWDFDELRELLGHHPSMSVCFHAALARAMASKLVDTHNPAVKYRHLLTGVLVDGVVTSLEKDELTKMRKLMKVNDTTHAIELNAAGWTAQEFDQGYHDVASSRGYEALLRETLREGVVDEEGRAALRKHRLANEIDSLHHVRVLKKLGWTLDDLEEGRKMDPPTAEDPVTKSSPSVPLADSLGQTPAQLEKENAALRNALSGSGDTPSSS